MEGHRVTTIFNTINEGLYRFFKDENLAAGLPPGTITTPQSGISDADSGSIIEKNISVPWVIDPAASYIQYNNWIEINLDAGIALHKTLPQYPTPVDTIASTFATQVNSQLPDFDFDTNSNGVNTISQSRVQDLVQRMATSTYRFVMRGSGVRAGYQIPIPGLRSVAGVAATPGEIQRAANIIIANASGVPIWFAYWELWYYITMPPKAQQLPPPNLAEHIGANQQLPAAIQVPYSPVDFNAVQTNVLRAFQGQPGSQ
jgi:hypothetical protein